MRRCGATLLAVAAAAVATGVRAHYAMNKPASWIDAQGVGNRDGWRGVGCTGEAPPRGEENVTGCISQWYSNYTLILGNATIADSSDLITYQALCRADARTKCGEISGLICREVCESMRRNPWRAPGTARVFSPCGTDGGNPDGCPVGNPGGGGCVSGGYGHGPDARTLPAGTATPPMWPAGSVQEVSFGLTANHGGGCE